MVRVEGCELTMRGGAVAKDQGAADEFALPAHAVKTSTVVGTSLTHAFHVNRKWALKTEVLASGALLVKRPGTRKGLRRVVRKKFVSGLGGTAEFAAYLAVEGR